MMRLLLLLVLLGATARAQRLAGYNYDERSLPDYTMLDPLRFSDGRAVTRASQWPARRAEILRLFEENVYGRTPVSARVPLRATIVEQSDQALSGRATRLQVDLAFTAQGPAGPHMRLLVYLPAHAKARVPVILGLNFGGNQTVLDDPAIRPSPVWSKPKNSALLHVAPGDDTRGSQAQQWPVEKIVAQGYGFATAYYGDLEPDFKDAAQLSVRALFGPYDEPDSWGAIGAWAWGLSRALDYLVSLPQVDPTRIAATGHSRLGKAADWAAAQDTRFAAVLSTESGKGGQSLSRRVLGETVLHLEHSFPYWFCPAYAQWAGHDTAIPADGNLLLALLAPRPVYVGSAVGDEWSDPHGEFLSALSAGRVYTLLGADALPAGTPYPPPDRPLLTHTLAYHVRTGRHDVTAFDWDQYLAFLDRVFRRSRR